MKFKIGNKNSGNNKFININIDWLIFVTLFILILSISVLQPINSLDELWNFNFAKNITDGLLPYKDFNMLQTPLLFYFFSAFLKLFGTELIVYRIVGSFIFTILFFLIYKILNKLKINKFVSILILFCIIGIASQKLSIDYNYVVLCFTLVTILIELCRNKKVDDNVDKENIEKNNIKDIVLEILFGAFVGTSILVKQTSGLVLSLVFISYKILEIQNKKDIKKYLKVVLLRFIGVIIPIVLFIIYLNINNMFNDFVDYTILGIKTFSNKLSYLVLICDGYGISLVILSIVIPITLVYMAFVIVKDVCINNIKNFNKEINDEKYLKRNKYFSNLIILFSYSIAAIVVAYPIADDIHFIIAMIPTLISFVYIINEKILKNINLENKLEKIICDKCKNSNLKIKDKFKNLLLFLRIFVETAIYVFMILICICGLYKFFVKWSYLKEIKCNHFKYIENNNLDDIQLVDDYILNAKSKGKKVYILDASAALFMIPMDTYNKNYDMFLKGNLGSKGEDGQIENLKNEKDVIVFVKNNKYSDNWQNPKKVKKYVEDNWNKIDEIIYYDVYERRDE